MSQFYGSGCGGTLRDVIPAAMVCSGTQCQVWLSNSIGASGDMAMHCSDEVPGCGAG